MFKQRTIHAKNLFSKSQPGFSSRNLAKTLFSIPVLALILHAGIVSVNAAQQTYQTLDDSFAAVARTVPEFGGMFLSDDEETLKVYLTNTNPSLVRAVGRAITQVFGPTVIPKNGITALQGRYGFLQLKGWYDQMTGPVLSIPGVTFTDINEARNLLVIGIAKEELRARVAARVEELSIPRDAVRIEVSGPITTLNHTLQMPNSVNPWPYSRVGGYVLTAAMCNQLGIGMISATLGFNIKATRGYGFVTVSHATAAWWKPDTLAGFPGNRYFSQSDNYYQNHMAGIEVADPHGFIGGACPVGLICRYSDSAIVRYNPGVKFIPGRIARTTGISISVPILTVNHSGTPAGEFAIIRPPSAPYLMGFTLNKVGQQTGWTSGKIQMTNANMSQIPSFYIQVGCPNGLMDPLMPPTGATLLSQYVVSRQIPNIIIPGDSGSPVFRMLKPFLIPPNSVELYGMAWGSFLGNNYQQFIFSPIGNVPSQMTGIQTDLGPFSYCEPSANPPC